MRHKNSQVENAGKVACVIKLNQQMRQHARSERSETKKIQQHNFRFSDKTPTYDKQTQADSHKTIAYTALA